MRTDNECDNIMFIFRVSAHRTSRVNRIYINWHRKSMNEWYAPQRTHAARPKWPRECFTSLVSVRQGHRAVIDKSAIYLPNAEIKCTKWFLIPLPPNQSHPRHRPTVQLGSIIIRMQWKCAELQIATNKINGKQKHLKFMLIAISGGDVNAIDDHNFKLYLRRSAEVLSFKYTGRPPSPYPTDQMQN